MFFLSFKHYNIRLALTLILILSGLSCFADNSTPDYRQMAQLAEYVGVDYPEAVFNGEVINEGEYQEMLEFSRILVTEAQRSKVTTIISKAQDLEAGIHERQPPEVIRRLGSELRRELLTLMPVSTQPSELLPIGKTISLFQTHCAACHGLMGKGDGVVSVGLEPAPTDFTDRERALNRSVLGLYDAISDGIEETAMVAYDQLNEEQRWSLAFYVGGLAFEASAIEEGEATQLSLKELINQNPIQLSNGDANTLKSITHLRAQPSKLFDDKPSPLQIARAQLLAARVSYSRGNFEESNRLAVSAYLDGFELVENSLDTRNPNLRKDIETNMMALRKQFRDSSAQEQLDTLLDITLAQLETAKQQLSANNLSNATLFSASLIILLREGLEALLVTLALVLVLIRSERRDALKFVHAGWISALIAGGITWWAARSLINISGASREVMEGVAALSAALVLFYVGVWMHSKSNSVQWQMYIQKHVTQRLKTGTLWGIAALAFVAVYREVFETVLFYEALLTQSLPAQNPTTIGGFLFGLICLSVIGWIMVRYSIKLPIGRFFSVTTYLLVALSFVLVGKGVVALQEAAFINSSPLPFSFEVDWIGLKSTWQSLLAQISILMLFLVVLLISNLRSRMLNE